MNQVRRGQRSARNGIAKDDITVFLQKRSWVWQKAPQFKGRKARCSDLQGPVIARQAKHVVAVIDGVPHDAFDSSHKMVYGYWARAE